jgi:hypothetical protein
LRWPSFCPASISFSPTLQQTSSQPNTDSKICTSHHQASRHSSLLDSTFTIFAAAVNKMPRWEDIRDDLFEAIIQAHPPINKEQQADIVKHMRDKGHDMGWNAIRYVRQSGSMTGPARVGKEESLRGTI